jgi:hypothetical protein
MKNAILTMLSVGALIVSAAEFVYASPLPPSPPPAVPEPGTFALLGVGAAGFFLYRKFKK